MRMKNKDFPSKFQKFKDALTEESVPVEIFPPRQEENFNTFHPQYFPTLFVNLIRSEYFENYNKKIQHENLNSFNIISINSKTIDLFNFRRIIYFTNCIFRHIHCNNPTMTIVIF